jgi:hypothetical protein
MPYAREAEIVLAMWRDIERQLKATDPGSDEEERLQADAARLRDEYRRLIDAARAAQRPLPAPWPEEATP